MIVRYIMEWGIKKNSTILLRSLLLVQKRKSGWSWTAGKINHATFIFRRKKLNKFYEVLLLIIKSLKTIKQLIMSVNLKYSNKLQISPHALFACIVIFLYDLFPREQISRSAVCLNKLVYVESSMVFMDSFKVGIPVKIYRYFLLVPPAAKWVRII